MSTGRFHKALVLKALALAAIGYLAVSPANAAIEKIDFTGKFDGGQSPFPSYPTLVTGELTYNTSNTSGAVYSNVAWYGSAIASFAFSSVGAGAASISGHYSSTGGGTFEVRQDYYGLDAIQTTVNLTGLAPTGYTLQTAGLFFSINPGILSSDGIPAVTKGATPWSEFSGEGFYATYTGPTGASVEIYANLTQTAVPEISTWAMMLGGFTGLGIASNRRRVLAA